MICFQVAASHFDANAIIHFGHACLSKVSGLPVHYVFPSFQLNPTAFADELKKTLSNTAEDIAIFYSTGYFYQLGIHHCEKTTKQIKIQLTIYIFVSM